MLLLAAGSAGAEGLWDPAFGPSQPDGPVRAATLYQGETYFGGDFKVAGRRDTPYVAKFANGRWVKPLGYPLGPVVDFLEHDGLYIAGSLATPGFYKSYVAVHDGQNWIRIGNLFTTVLEGLEFVGGEIYAFGAGVYRWDGANWIQEAGISGGKVLWLAELKGELYAATTEGTLYRRLNGLWERRPLYFWSGECFELGTNSGVSTACVARAEQLVMLGDFWGIKEVGGANLVTSPQVLSFDGLSFGPIDHPWLNGCNQSLTIGSSIVHAADLGSQILAVGRFYIDALDSPPVWTLALHDGVDWQMLQQLTVSPSDARIFSSQGFTAVATRSCSRLGDSSGTTLGRLAAFDPTTRELQSITESTTLGLRGHDKGAGKVVALAVHEGRIVVGGDVATPVGLDFQLGDGVIAAIDGDRYTTLITPGFVTPTALLSSGRGLYAADSDVLVRLGEGEERETIVSDIRGSVYTLAEYNDALILAGAFDALDGAPIHNLASFDGNTPTPFGEPDAAVRALAWFEGDLIVGGDFTQIGGVGARCLARWDGENFQPMGEPFTNSQFGESPSVRALCVWEGALYAGGDFTFDGERPFGYVARWDGAAWQPLTPIDLNAPVNCMIEHDGRLFIGGEFHYAGNVFMGRLTAFDGERWVQLNANANAPVRTLASSDGDLYVGGEFALLGGWNSFGLGRWRAAARIESPAPPRAFWFTGVKPNPFNPSTSFVFQIPTPGPVEIEIFDAKGRLLRQLRQAWSVPGELRIEWDGEDDAGNPLASGTYRVRARYAGATTTRTATLLR